MEIPLKTQVSDRPQPVSLANIESRQGPSHQTRTGPSGSPRYNLDPEEYLNTNNLSSSRLNGTFSQGPTWTWDDPSTPCLVVRVSHTTIYVSFRDT